MGCSATKNLVVEPLQGQKQDGVNGHVKRKVSYPLSSGVPPLEGEEPQTEVLEATVNNVQKGVNGLSFEIAFQDEPSDSIIKKHPPKRFQKLEEDQLDPTVTLVKLQEKLDEAEVRRQQILQQRVQSAKIRHVLRKQSSVASSDDDPDHLRVPPEQAKVTNPYDVSYV